MEKLKIGKIVGTHALKGELKIRSFSDFNDQRFVVGHKLYLNEIVDPFIIKTVRVHKGNYLISFEGLQDINLVEKYIGYNVYGLKEDVELDDDEYFYDDLIGCQIINNDQEIGKVESVYFNGAHDVLTVQTANKKIAIPYVDAFIENEDIENKKILEQKEHLNDGLLEFQENYFQTIQFKVKKMMKNKLGYLYDNYFMDVYHHDEITNRHQIQLEALIQIMIMVVLLFSIFIYKKQQMTLGTVMLVYLLLSYMIDPLMKISVFIAMHDELQIIFERYKEMLPEKRERKKKIKKIKSIELKHVSFSYGYTRPLFDHFQLKMERSLFIQGKTGSGKSTLLKLIMNQLQPTKGEIVINGINLQELDLNSYYSHIKYLNKTPVFYKESLRTNMIFDRLFLENKMIELLHYFMLDDLVNGLDLKLDEQGGFLSSGQGQLVMIIRALLSEPDVLILDEAFSNIDQERLQLLINYLSFQKIIVIIVSHQINMMNCQFDCVIIDSGKIVGEEDYGNRFST